MDAKEIETMEAGRELDHAIAQRVMLTEDGGTLWHEDLDCGYPDCPNCVMNCPHYSTDIADAWKVVEKLRENGAYLRLRDIIERDVVYAEFYRPPARCFPASAKEAPLAICRAALLTVNQEAK